MSSSINNTLTTYAIMIEGLLLVILSEEQNGLLIRHVLILHAISYTCHIILSLLTETHR